MSRLFDDNDSDSDLKLNTGSGFAKNYNTWRKKEELHKLQAKYGDESSESSSSEDDEGEQVNEQFEKEFFKTLSCLKNKDPRIYNKDVAFFEGVREIATKKVKNQPVFIKDYERNLIVERGGQLSDDEIEDTDQIKSSTYVEEQKELKDNLKTALENIDEQGEEEWGGIFKTRQKTAEEQLKEEHEYLQWLTGQKEHLEDETAENELKPLKEYWTNPKLDEGERFLRDYLLKKKFLDTENTDYIPTYDEVVHDSDENLSEDEKVVETQEEFEHKYNFRFEEPDQDFIKRYPRTLENSLRQKDDKRKIKRSERKERKIVEKKQKMEEIQQLKALKRQEIEEKIKKLKEITGNTEVGFDIKDIEDDFNPEEHDKRMQALFDNEFYNGPEGEQKPEFPEIDEELELENWDYWHGNDSTPQTRNDEPHCEDDDFNMDCDYDPLATQKELIENSKTKKKRRRKSKFAKVLSEPKPTFDPNNKTYQEYLDEYYKLDCEDVIGDIPCRFKYREVIPNSFGLSIEEILTAKDKELNRWCSLKKAIQHRPDHVEKYDVIAFEKKSKNIGLKMKCLPSLFVDEMPPSTSTITSATPINNQEPITDAEPSTSSNVSNEIINKETTKTKDTTSVSLKMKSRKRKHLSEPQQAVVKKNTKKNNRHVEKDIGITDARLTAYGINPKKFKNKLKYGNN